MITCRTCNPEIT